MRKNAVKKPLSLAQKSLLLTLFCLPLYLLRFNLGPLPLNVYEVLVGLSGILFIWENRGVPMRGTLKLFLIATLTLTALATARALHFPSAPTTLPLLLTALKVSFTSGLMLLMLDHSFYRKRREKLIYQSLALSAIALGLFSLFYNFVLGLNLQWDARLTGPMDSAVYLAFFFSPALIMSTAFPKKTALALATILGLLLLATKSFGAFLALAGVGLIWLYKHKKTPLTTLQKSFIGLVLLALSALTFWVKILPAFQLEYSSLGERFQIWLTAFYSLENPLTLFTGLGLYQFQAFYELMAPKILGQAPMDTVVLQPHNLIFWAQLNYGVFGSLALLASLGRAIRQIQHHPSLPLATFIFFYFFFHGQLDTPLFRHESFLLFLLALWSLWKPLDERLK